MHHLEGSVLTLHGIASPKGSTKWPIQLYCFYHLCRNKYKETDLYYGRCHAKSKEHMNTHSVYNTQAASKGVYTQPLLRNSQQQCPVPEQHFPLESEPGLIFANLQTDWLFHTAPEQKSQLALEAALCPLHHSSGNPANCLLIEEERISVVQTRKKAKPNKIKWSVSLGGALQNDWLFNFMPLQCLFLSFIEPSPI